MSMKQVLKDLAGLLVADTTVSAAVSTRVYPGLAPPDATLPLIVYRFTEVDRPKTHDQRDTGTRRKADRYSFSVSLVGRDIDALCDLADAVDSALDGRTALTGTALLLFDGAEMNVEYSEEDSGERVYQIDMRFISVRAPVA